jgi:hypothetical protein
MTWNSPLDGILVGMSDNGYKTDKAAQQWSTRHGRLRLECRECEVICERVVSPWHCLKTSCRFVYVFEDSDTRYFGCLNKVFSPELDLAAFDRVLGGARAGDPYGSIKVANPARHECRVTIEQAYSPPAGQSSCCNPTFFHHPVGSGQEGMRLTANVPIRQSDSELPG